MPQAKNLLTLREASRWASDFLKRDVSESNISYLVQYGKIKKHNGGNSVLIAVDDLKNIMTHIAANERYAGKNDLVMI